MKILKFTSQLLPNWLSELDQVPDGRLQSRCKYSMKETLFSGIMMFLLRYRSLRSFTLEHRGNELSLDNFSCFISLSDIPDEDSFRYILEPVTTDSVNLILKKIHQRLERQKILDAEKFFGSLDLLSLDGTGQLSSCKVNCEFCLTKNSSDGRTHFMHGQLLASLTNQSGKYSMPLQFEPIQKDSTQTQYSKNDCELNAAKRLLQKLRTEFPKRNFCILADNLLAVDPILSVIESFSWKYIVTAKPDRNKEVFFMFEYLWEQKQQLERLDSKGHLHRYEWTQNLPLKQYSKTEKQVLTNLVVYQELSLEGEILYQSSWVTNLPVDKWNVTLLVSAARARFGIENRNFNEQKNLGFHIEHNFGHSGNLPNVFFGLAQIAQLFSILFKHWKLGAIDIKRVGSCRRYFEKLAVVVAELDLGATMKYEMPNYLKFDFDST
jgi:hypothetical protein